MILFVCMCMHEIGACVSIHVLACVGMPTEITIYLSTDHIRAEESSSSIREVGPKKKKKIMPAVIT